MKRPTTADLLELAEYFRSYAIAATLDRPDVARTASTSG